MHKGYKRDEKGIAILKFFIGLIVVAIIIGIIYFFLQKVDYSDKIADPEATMRPYVEMTAEPEAPLSVSFTDEAPDDLDIVDLTGEAAYDESDEAFADELAEDFAGEFDDEADFAAEPEIIATQEPTPEPTFTPEPTPITTPTPTPIPTPEPTPIAANLFSAGKIGGFTVPAVSNEIEGEITKIYVSPANNNAVVQIDGYAYINQELFDASKMYVFMIVTQKSSGKQIAYQAKTVSGVSGDPHVGAICLNPASADFEAVLDVSKYPEGEYKLGVVLYYLMNDKKSYAYYEFPQTITMTAGAAAASGADIGGGDTFLPSEEEIAGEEEFAPEEAFMADTAEEEPYEEDADPQDFSQMNFVG